MHFATDDLPWQRSLRWSEPPRDRRLLWLGGLFALLITLAELGGFAIAMRDFRALRPRPSPPIQVSLIVPFEQLPPPPPEPEPPIVARSSRIAIAPPEVKTTPPPPRPAESATTTQGRLGSAGAAAPQLFNPDGSIRLGGGGAPSLPKAPANPREAAKARWAEIEARGNPLDCRKTRFAKAFAPDESVGNGIARKYLKWVGLADMGAIAHDNAKRAQAGGCEPAE
ncbi:MAG: hypothetical protein GXC76_15365 [Rhodanobacteraceae bacterium]|nr:hypothetical protein [Rhodanobacteraceae bacterium]